MTWLYFVFVQSVFVFVLAGSTLTVAEEIRHLRIAADSG
jgi:hypothetical protein